jgi:CelD/BcsL family acetyltransferase involved in cellulose biosynthesis
MYETRIAAGHLTVTAGPGLAPALDVLALRNLGGHGFLRAAWYGEDAPQALHTLVVENAEGTPLAAIPTVSFGPGIAGARRVAGLYWPFRSVLLAPECTVHELAEALTRKSARMLGRVWRLGPARMDDPAALTLIAAADAAGWHVLSRPAGTSWVIDLDAMRITGRPRNSVARKLRAGWRKLEALGTPHWRVVRGAQWDDSVLEDLARVEADSWIARATNGSGAKFLTAGRQAYWRAVLADPVLAERLSATILMLDTRPVAFSFDLDDGPVRYAIAGTHAEDLKHCNIGKQVNYRMLDECLASGLSRIDLGSGDNGYKAEMGAHAAYDLADLLLVRGALAARVLAKVWGARARVLSGSLAHG